MKLHQLIEGYNGPKAGIIPYLADGRMLFMVSSDAAYGGASPQFAKGRVDGKESNKEAAVREGEEELGLRKSNMVGEPFLGWAGEMSGMDATYKMDVYAVQVSNEKDFDKPHYETERTVWLTMAEFKTHGRKSQLPQVESVAERIAARDSK